MHAEIFHSYKLPKNTTSWNELFDRVVRLANQEGGTEVTGDWTISLYDNVPEDKLRDLDYIQSHSDMFMSFHTLTMLALIELREVTFDAPECEFILSCLKFGEPNYMNQLNPPAQLIYTDAKDKLYKLLKFQST